MGVKIKVSMENYVNVTDREKPKYSKKNGLMATFVFQPSITHSNSTVFVVRIIWNIHIRCGQNVQQMYYLNSWKDLVT
jgi:hypothetical protein